MKERKGKAMFVRCKVWIIILFLPAAFPVFVFTATIARLRTDARIRTVFASEWATSLLKPGRRYFIELLSPLGGGVGPRCRAASLIDFSRLWKCFRGMMPVCNRLLLTAAPGWNKQLVNTDFSGASLIKPKHYWIRTQHLRFTRGGVSSRPAAS